MQNGVNVVNVYHFIYLSLCEICFNGTGHSADIFSSFEKVLNRLLAEQDSAFNTLPRLESQICPTILPIPTRRREKRDTFLSPIVKYRTYLD